MLCSYTEREVMLNTGIYTVWRWVEEVMWHKFGAWVGGMFCTKTYTVTLSYKLATRVELCNKRFSWETSLVAKTIFDFACSYCRNVAVQSICRTPNYIKHTDIW